MKKLALFATVILLGFFVPWVTASAAYLYVDQAGTCDGYTPCYTHPQDAVNEANSGDTIKVYPGTYQQRMYTFPKAPFWTYPGDQYAPALIVWKDGLTIQAVDPDPAKTILQTTYGTFWVNKVPIQASTGGTFVCTARTNTNYPPVPWTCKNDCTSPGCPWTCRDANGVVIAPIPGHVCSAGSWSGNYVQPVDGTAPFAVAIIASGVTIRGFSIGAASTSYTALLIGSLGVGGEPNPLGAQGDTVENNVFPDVFQGVFIWHSPDNTIRNNRVIQASFGCSIQQYDGYTVQQVSATPQSQNNLISGNTIEDDSAICLGAWGPQPDFGNTTTDISGSRVCCNDLGQTGFVKVEYAQGPVLIGCNDPPTLTLPWPTYDVLQINGVTYTGDTYSANGNLTLSAALQYEGTADGSGVEVVFTVDGQKYSATTGAGGTATTTASLSPGNYVVETKVSFCDGCCEYTDSVSVAVVCPLVVEKECFVKPPPAAPFVCSDAKPIDSMTVIWNGADTIYVIAWNGSVGTGTPQPFGPIAPKDEVTFTRSGTFPNDIYWQICSDAACSNEIGRSTFHLSCSDADMNDPEDCGKPAGNGKTTSTSYINTWTFDGMKGNGLVLDCPPAQVEGIDACSFVAPPPPPPDCATLGKPKSLTFKYSGVECVPGSNNQAADKWACNGFPGAGSVNITILKDPARITVSPDSGIKIGDLVTVSLKPGQKDMGAEIQLNVGSQFLKIHTSCSQPLAVGDVFGSLELVKFNGQSTGADVTYTYKVENKGDTNVTLASASDNLLGDLLFFDNEGVPCTTLDPGASCTAQVTALITETTTNTVTVTGTVVSSNFTCTAEDSLTVTVTQPEIEVVAPGDPWPGDHWLYWDLTNNGPDTATITKVEVTKWPSQQGKLKKIKLEGVTAADPADIPWPGPAVITKFVSDITARQIAAGQTRTFAIEFEKNYPVSSNSNANYSLTITFEGGETLNWSPPPSP